MNVIAFFLIMLAQVQGAEFIELVTITDTTAVFYWRTATPAEGVVEVRLSSDSAVET